MALVASVVFGDPGGHGSEEGVVSSIRGEHQGRGTTEQSSRQHKSLSSHPPAFDQVLLISMYLFAEIAAVLVELDMIYVTIKAKGAVIYSAVFVCCTRQASKHQEYISGCNDYDKDLTCIGNFLLFLSTCMPFIFIIQLKVHPQNYSILYHAYSAQI